jgi:hypothetical protein
MAEQIIARSKSKSLEADDGYFDIPFPMGYQGLPRAEVERAIRYLDKYGYTDPVLRKYNILCWIRGYYQDNGKNHGEHYADLVTEQNRLGDILEEDGHWGKRDRSV